MNKESLEDLYAMDCESRYDYTLSQVVEERTLWILINEDQQFLKIYSEDERFEYLPVWPSAELAELYAGDASELQAKSISLPDFLKTWVTGLEKDQLEVGVFPGTDSTVWVTSGNDFKRDIQEELNNI